MKSLPAQPVAISFAFPGPADYPKGIIGDLPNLPAFRGGVPLKAYLEEKFQMPVYINNDGDLFAYGEALAGFLPSINQKLSMAGSARRYKNLVGVTLGTGFGCGIVRDSELLVGDNSAAAEAWCMSRFQPTWIAEDMVNSAAVIRYYEESCGGAQHVSAFDVYQIAIGSKDGSMSSALAAFDTLGRALGNALVNIVSIVDGLVVIGGGVAGAHELFMPAVIATMNSLVQRANGEYVNRMVLTAYNAQSDADMGDFLKSTSKKVGIAGTSIAADYDPVRRTAIGISAMGDTLAMATGAYCFALYQLDKK
jgi:glucokinase